MTIEHKLKAILETHMKSKGTLITLLQQTEAVFGYLPEEAVVWFSKKLDIPESRFFGIATFYSQFHLKPTGKNTITVCCGAACHIKGANEILAEVRSALNLSQGEDTTQDLSFTVQKATCIGACSIAPVAILNDQVYGNVDAGQVVKLVKGFEKEGEYTGFEYD